MDFSKALSTIKEKNVSLVRDGWNGSGMRLLMHKPKMFSEMTHPYLYLIVPGCVEGNRRIPWQPSQVDLFSDDWRVVK